MNFTELGNAKYIALETFRKNGEGVITPVWVTAENDKLYVWTVDNSWKVKRIRNNSRVRIAVCDARGKPKSEWSEGTATVLSAPEDDVRQRERLAAKYGMMYRVITWMYKLRRESQARVVLEIKASPID